MKTSSSGVRLAKGHLQLFRHLAIFWLLLQPRDYINGLQLLVALGVMYLAMLMGNSTIVAPALNLEAARALGAPSLVPLLFVTVVCGAISDALILVAMISIALEAVSALTKVRRVA